MKRIKKELTCFYSDGVEYQTCKPIADEAQKRGYKVHFSDNLWEKAEIGLYCQHTAFPQNSRLSIVMLHDMAQQHGNWPNIWLREPWDVYDIGILPGPDWERRWQECTYHPFVHPRYGVIRGGWPKADKMLSMQAIDKDKLKREMGLTKEHVLMYAPSWEYNHKQDDFVQQLINLDVDLILKQAPWSDAYPEQLALIHEMNQKHQDIASNVHIIPCDVNIFDCILISDIIVSDESSVMFEGLLMNVPSIAVKDWLIPDTIPAREPSIPYEFVRKIKSRELLFTINDMLSNLDENKAKLEQYCNMNFYKESHSSTLIMNAIDTVLDGGNINSIVPIHKKKKLPIKDWYLKQYRYSKSYCGHILRKVGLR